ncbi:MAG TPA: hypothetical protein VFT44_23920 [Pyrinomonadaceae bacterium]|nr:hypothetical protein [Pyrinomonadaceae bacterium]
MTSLLSCSRLVQAGFDFTPSRIPLTGGGASNDSAPFKRSILWFFGLSRNGGNIHVHPEIPFITI